MSDSFVTSKDLMQFSDKNNDAHNDLRRELEGKINSVKGELEHQLNAVKESRKWWLNIVLPIIMTLIIGVIGYFVSASIKEDIRALETTIDEMLKPTVYELKEDLKDLTKNFYTNNRNAEFDKNTDSEPIRKLIYTTNTVEGYHRQIRKVTKNKGVFPNDTALIKLV